MEIIITIVVFWLLLAAAYAVYYISHERTRRSTSVFLQRPESDVEHLPAETFASGPFDMPTRPVSISTAEPEFVARAQTGQRPSISLTSSAGDTATDAIGDQAESNEEVAGTEVEVLRYVSRSQASPIARSSVHRQPSQTAKTTAKQKATSLGDLGSEVETLRAELERLRSEFESLSESKVGNSAAPRQRRSRAAASGSSQAPGVQRREAT